MNNKGYYLASVALLLIVLIGSCKEKTVGVPTLNPPGKEQKVGVPTMNPPCGEYVEGQKLSLVCPMAGAVIYYTLDGSDPTESSPAYSGPILLPVGAVTVKARAFKQKWIPSSLATGSYKITKEAFAEMVFVRGGTFTMGGTRDPISPDGDSFRGKEKRWINVPTHQVALSSFYMGNHEITQGEFFRTMGYLPDGISDTFGRGKNYPVYDVSWFEAIKYCNLRSIEEGLTPSYSIMGSTNPDSWGDVPDSQVDASWFGTEIPSGYNVWNSVLCNWEAEGYRLPTEAEWEYAARGGKSNHNYRFSGSDDLNKVAWTYEDSGIDCRPVGTKSSNELGIFDMSGNVAEYCWDIHTRYTPQAKTNPRGPDRGDYRVCRNNGLITPYTTDIESYTVSFRDECCPYLGSVGVGFRVCRSILDGQKD